MQSGVNTKGLVFYTFFRSQTKNEKRMHNTVLLPATFAFIPDFIQKNHELSMAERMTYSVIASVSGRKKFCWHSQKELSERIGCSLSTFKRCVCRLMALGLLATKANVHGHTLCYYPLSPASSQVAHSELPLAHDELQIIKDNIKQRNFSPLPPQAAHPKNPITISAFSRALPVRNTSSVVREGVGETFSDFEELWNRYPRHDAKGTALAVWKNLKRGQKLPALSVLLKCVSDAKETWAWTKEGGRYVPYLSNWLRGQRWMDASEKETDVAAVRPKADLSSMPKMPEPPVVTDEDREGFKRLLSGITDSLSPGEEAAVFAIWRSLHRKGLTLTAADCTGSGPLWRRMTVAAKRLEGRV